MKTNKALTLVFVVSFIMSAILLPFGIALKETPKKIDLTNGDMPEPLVQHDPIKINDDSEFLVEAANNGWAGDGTPADPFIIENYTIDADGYTYGIFIANTTYDFIIKDTEIFQASLTDWDWNLGAGITLFNCTNSTIANNHLHNNSNGVYTRETFNISIYDNNIRNCGNGILSASDSTENKIIANFISQSSTGIYLSYSDSTFVEYNYVTGSSSKSIDVVGSLGSHIYKNTMESNSKGICFFESHNNEILGNDLNGTSGIGLNIVDSDHNTIRSNRISFSSEEGILLGKVWNEGSMYNEVYHNNLYYNNGSFDQYDPMHVQARDLGKDNKWNNTEGEGNYWFDWAYNNNTNDADHDGIINWPYVINRTGEFKDHYPLAVPIKTERGPIRINNNNDFTFKNGVIIGNGTEVNPYIIEGYDIDGGGEGYSIYIGNTTVYFALRHCYLHNASGDGGIYKRNAGLYLYDVENVKVTNITTSSNGYYGIYLQGCNSNTLYSNAISYNEQGIHLDSSGNNIIYHNNFIDNSGQAYDDSDNRWNVSYSTGGNYWSDYEGDDIRSGPDQDQTGSDGIGDIPYTNIDGGSNADEYPLMNPTITIIEFSFGWNFISFPCQDTSAPIEYLLSGISWDKAMAYSDGEWHSYMPSRSSHLNDGFPLPNNTHGIWVHAIEQGTLNVSTKNLGTTYITLEPGWNMVGYPSRVSRIAVHTLPSLISKIGVFNGSQEYDIEYIHDLSTYIMDPGEGYWVYNGADYAVEWAIDY